LSEIYLSYDAVAYVLLAITVKHREYPLLACISPFWATEGLTDEGKKKENRTASGTSLRSMILPEMISGAQLRWSQKRTYPSVRNIRQDQTNFSNANDEMKGEAKIQTRDIWLKACKSFIQMQYPSIATLLHPLFF